MIKSLAKSTVKSIVLLAVALVMFGAMKKTQPSHMQHANAVTATVEKVVDDIIQNKVAFPQKSRELADYLTSDVVPKAVEKLTNGQIDITDYWIFNVGSIEGEDGESAVTIGCFGKVFTIDEEQIRKDIEESVTKEMKDFINYKQQE